MNYFYIFLMASVILVDRVSKSWMLINQHVSICSFLSCDLTFNRGIIFGFLGSAGTLVFWIMTACGILTCSFLLWYAVNYYTTQSMVGEVLILAGGLCNMYDRLFFPGVIDFIVLSYHSFVWPVFNIADVSIVIGIIYIICNFFLVKKTA